MGFEQGSVVLGGRKVKVRRPRIRSVAGQEVELPTYEQLSELWSEVVYERVM